MNILETKRTEQEHPFKLAGSSQVKAEINKDLGFQLWTLKRRLSGSLLLGAQSTQVKKGRGSRSTGLPFSNRACPQRKAGCLSQLSASRSHPGSLRPSG